MKILFDHNVPYGLRKFLVGHEVSLANEMGWAEVSNGILLRAAEEAGFELMITCDKNLSYQQNLRYRSIALLVLSQNNWNQIKRNTSPIVSAIEGRLQEVFASS